MLFSVVSESRKYMIQFRRGTMPILLRPRLRQFLVISASAAPHFACPIRVPPVFAKPTPLLNRSPFRLGCVSWFVSSASPSQQVFP